MPPYLYCDFCEEGEHDSSDQMNEPSYIILVEIIINGCKHNYGFSMS